MLMNNLHPDVAENPQELVVYGGIGRAARNWEAFDLIVDELKRLGEEETLLVQSGKPVGVFQTHGMLRASLSPTRTWFPPGPTGSTSGNSIARVS